MSAIFSVTINPGEAEHYYGVTSSRGYTIKSAQSLEKDQKEKIREIVGEYWGFEMAQDQMEVREEKFQKYVAWRPKEKWAEEAEYSNYEGAKIMLDKALKSWLAVKEKYQVIDINSFRKASPSNSILGHLQSRIAEKQQFKS